MLHRYLTVLLLLVSLCQCKKEEPEAADHGYRHWENETRRDYYFTGVLIDSIGDTLNNYGIYRPTGNWPCLSGYYVSDFTFVLSACEFRNMDHSYSFDSSIAFYVIRDTVHWDSVFGRAEVATENFVEDDTVEVHMSFEYVNW